MHDVSSNYFELYDLAIGFQIDSAELAEKHRLLMAMYHPDKHVQSDTVTKRHASQMAATVNESYRVLKSPLSRAGYLLELVGLDGKADSETTNDGAFLMQQMELREMIAAAKTDADPFSVLDQAQAQADQTKKVLFADFQRDYEAEDFSAAREAWVKLKFFTRLQNQIEKQEQELEDQ